MAESPLAAAPLRSAIRNPQSVSPLAVRRTEDRQFFHHKLGFSDRADHVSAGGGIPFLRHAFAGVATPALNVGGPGKHPSINLLQLVFVQPRLAGAIDHVAVVEHKAGLIGMAEIFETADL